MNDLDTEEILTQATNDLFTSTLSCKKVTEEVVGVF